MKDVSLRIRKSFQVVPGVRLNVSKTGVGVSVGPRGARYSIHSSGRQTRSVRTGIPGVYFQDQRRVGQGRSTGASAPRDASAAAPAKPGLFAPKGEKALYAAVLSGNPQLVAQSGLDHEDVRLPAYSLAGFMMAEDDPQVARTLLVQAFALGDPAEHAFTQKYLQVVIDIDISFGVTAHQYLGRDAVGLILAELHQEQGEYQEALDVLSQLHPSTVVMVSVADVLTEGGAISQVIELTDGIRNEDDMTALLCAFRGRALRLQGHHDAAHEALKEALKSKSRHAAIRHEALSERAENYLAQGKRALARKDMERIYAEDSTYPGLEEALAAVRDK